MSDGKTHSAVTIGATAGLLAGYYSGYFIDPHLFPIVAASCLAGIALSPDTDVDGGYIGHYYARKIFGKPGEWYYNGIMKPYQLSFKHRSFWSHFPLISTLLRLTYMAMPFIIIPFSDQDTPVSEIFIRCIISSVLLMPVWFILYTLHPDWGIFVSVYIGLALSDTLHYLFDYF